jgi:hypothetical protein
MGRQVIIIASGETERRALPHLVKHLQAEGTAILEVRIPPGHKQLTIEMAEKLVKAAWFERIDAPPDKFVVLLDLDGKDAHEVLGPFRDQLPGRLGPKVKAPLRFACACWHLEAWYFADDQGLRNYLGGALGNIDPSAPDSIQNPKLHLKHLLGRRAYTAVVSEEIASGLDPVTITQRSPSFLNFLGALRNGVPLPHADLPAYPRHRRLIRPADAPNPHPDLPA